MIMSRLDSKKTCEVFIKQSSWRAWRTAQSIKPLLCKHEDLSSNPWHPHKGLEMVTESCDSSAERWRQEDHSGLLTASVANW